MDVLRENIGLLQLPYEDEYYYDEEDINEGFLGFGKKKSRWQRFKDAIKNNKGKIAAGALAGALNYRTYNWAKDRGKMDWAKKNSYTTIGVKGGGLPTLQDKDGNKFVAAYDNSGKEQIIKIDREIHEGFLPFSKKKSRWQRFKDMVKRNKKNIILGTLGTGLSMYGTNKLGKHNGLNTKLNLRTTAELSKLSDGSPGIHIRYDHVDPNGKIYKLNAYDELSDGTHREKNADVDRIKHPFVQKSDSFLAKAIVDNMDFDKTAKENIQRYIKGGK